MAYPEVARIELPILQELVATGGAEDVRFLYAPLITYFPQLDEKDIHSTLLGNGHHRRWRRLVQRAGRALDEKREIERRHGRWSITHRGRERAGEESLDFPLTGNSAQPAAGPTGFSHADIQRMLSELGRLLGHYPQCEFEYYDVVWRASEASPRLSHVFEVQRKGNIDAALAKLKRAYEAQRSRTFLIVTSESDTARALKQMSLARAGAFHEIERATTILSFEQLHRLHRALTSVADLLPQIFEK